MNFFVGLDGGGTKTVAVMIDSDGAVLARVRMGPSTYKSRGLPVAAGVLTAAIAAVAGDHPVARLVAGVSDVDTRNDQRLLSDAVDAGLHERQVLVGCIDVVNDAVIALASGTSGAGAGVACIAGTGSVAFGVDGLAGEARAGGWGPPFGDAGGAY